MTTCHLLLYLVQKAQPEPFLLSAAILAGSHRLCVKWMLSCTSDVEKFGMWLLQVVQWQLYEVPDDQEY